MKSKKISMVCLAAALLISLLSGCGAPKSAETEKSTAVSVTDMMGRQINLDRPASKVVVLTASDCEIIYALGAGDAVIARGEYCNYPEEALNVTEVSSGGETNIEQIISLKPDVVMMDTMAQTVEQVQALENAGIPVLVNNAKTIDEVYKSIEIIGKMVGKETEASGMVSEMKKSFDKITASADKNSGKTVYFEVSPLEYGLWTAGKGTFMDEIATMLGVTNIFSDVSGWAEISQEQVIERNPDYIVTIYMGIDGQQSPTEEIMSRKGWENVKAVASGNVETINSDEISRPGPRLVDSAISLQKLFYGE